MSNYPINTKLVYEDCVLYCEETSGSSGWSTYYSHEDDPHLENEKDIEVIELITHEQKREHALKSFHKLQRFLTERQEELL